MDNENNIYSKIGEIYLKNDKEYSFLCLYCDDTFHDFSIFKDHNKIHLSEPEIIDNESVSSDLKTQIHTEIINIGINLDNQIEILDSSLDFKLQELEIEPDSTEKVTEIDTNDNQDLNNEQDENFDVQSEQNPNKALHGYLNEIEIKQEESSKICCPYCKVFYKFNYSHDIQKCSKVQETISKCNGDFIKLLKEGVLCCVQCSRYFEDYESLYDHHKEAEHCNYKDQCKICKLYKFMNLKISEKQNLTKNNIKETKGMSTIENPLNNLENSREEDTNDFFDDLESNKNVEFPFKCSFCDKLFRSKYQMNIHMRIHTNNRPYKCKYCHSAFTVAANLKNHIVYKHTEDKPFVCKYENCNKRFKLMDLKNQHEKRHLPASFQCEVCGKYFKARIYLLIHQRNVHEDPKNWKFQCDFCDKKFPGRSRFNEHKRIHTGEKPYSCDMCEKFFRKASTLKQHKKLHSEERKYVCRFCGKGFKQCAGYWGHMKKHPIK